MLTRLLMLDKKISISARVGCVFTLLAAFCGCSPTGPSAFHQGEKLLEAGDYDAAYGPLKLAATLLKTNAVAWDDFGVAAQRTGQAVDAANAYQRALELDHDLVEAHFNLGCLYLEQNQSEPAREELASYTMRRPNDPEGWRKLGSAQLRLGETALAERSFSAVLHLVPEGQDAEAYNGLGVACLQRSQPRNAVKFFTAAVQLRPDYAAAILNLASTSEQYLRDNQTALANYEKYLSLTPRPADWDQVNAIVMDLSRTAAPATPAAPPAVAVTSPPPAANNPTPAPAATVKPPVRPTPPPSPRPTLAARVNPPPPVRPVAPSPQPKPPASASPQVVRLTPEPSIVASANPPVAAASASGAGADVVVVGAEPPPKPGFWQRLKPSHWFNGGNAESGTDSEFVQSGVTPLTATPAGSAPPVVMPTTPLTPYQYISPDRPVSGDHRAASGAYTKARMYEQDERWSDAMVWYGHAAEFDPAWFEAHYNEGLLAERTRNYGRALKSFELALALRPDSVEARYHFALTLRAAEHPADAVHELEKILAAHPDDVRAHLTLANIYAETLHEPSQARREYETVLQLSPNHPSAAQIRAWLRLN